MKRVKILRASAGSGKTYRLAYEYVKLVVCNPRFYSHILAVTFTNKATAEMKSRILRELHSIAQGESSYMESLLRDTTMSQIEIIENATIARGLILHGYSDFAISTIDKFFQRVVRSFFKELGLGFDYSVELDTDSLLAEAVDRVVERGLKDRELLRLIETIVGEKVEQGGSWDIRPGLQKIGRELMNETYRDSETPIEDLEALLKTYSAGVEAQIETLRASCGKALTLMQSVGIEPSDIKGASRSFAHYFAKIYRGDAIDCYSDTFSAAAHSPEQWYTAKSPRKSEILSILTELMQVTADVVARYDAIARDMATVELISENFNRSMLLKYISEEFAAIFTERNRLPLHEATRLIGRLVEGTDIPFIYEKVGNRYENYMIDEFQDTSRGQWRNFVPLLSEAVARSESQSVMLIGDVKQAIYRWRSGDWNILAREAQEYFGSDADHLEQLSTNWRSTSRIIEFNNRLIRGIVAMDSVVIEEMLEAAPRSVAVALRGILAEAYMDFEQGIAPSRKGVDDGYVEVVAVEKGAVDHVLLSRVADTLSRGYTQRDIAILVRTKREGRQVADTLLSAGYNIVSEEAMRVGASAVVDFITALFGLSIHPGDTVQLSIVNRFTEKSYNTPPSEELSEFIDSLSRVTPIEALELVIHRFELSQLSTAVTYIQAFYQLLYKYCNDNLPDMRLFLDWWNDKGRDKPIFLPSEQEAITIMTIHKSKGLEFTCVILPFADWSLLPMVSFGQSVMLWGEASCEAVSGLGSVPVNYKKLMAESWFDHLYYAESIASHVDNINLLYVALTRAERELYVMHSPKPSVNSIARLIEEAVCGVAQEHNGIYTYGTKMEAPATHIQRHNLDIVFDSFPSNPSGQHVRSSWQSERYFAGEESDYEVSPRAKGVQFHAILSHINSLSDIGGVIDDMQAECLLSREEAEQLHHMADSIATDPVKAEWFAEGWRVYNETQILHGAGKGESRPDRVVCRNSEAIVVDYKFGEVEKNSYKKQTANYMKLLLSMGYTNVRGYIWYINKDKTVEIELSAAASS